MIDREQYDWQEIVCRGVESDRLDYKAAQSWNTMSAAGRAKIVRHLTAFANTEGGFLVIGVGEDSSGVPSLRTGLTEEESRSFDPSAVGSFVNRCVEPPIDFTLERPMVLGKRYAIFTVRPFSGLPHVCSTSFDGELQTGVFYIRTPDAASRPARRASELHALVARALRNQREMLAAVLRGILYDGRTEGERREIRRAIAADEEEDIFNDSLLYFKRRRVPSGEAAIFQLSLAPGAFSDARFTHDRLAEAAEKALSLSRAEPPGFIAPGETAKCHRANRALRRLDDRAPRMFQLFRSGAFHYIGLPAGPEGRLDAGDFLRLCADGAAFLGGYLRELGFDGELFTLRFSLAPLGRTAFADGDGAPLAARIAEVSGEYTRRAADFSEAPERYAERIFRSVAEAYTLPETRIAEFTAAIRRRVSRS